MKVDVSTEQLILEAAEAEFLEKGFQVAKTTVIAKRAGVTQAMLNYYFRTKENLFQMVFKKKSQLIASSFLKQFNESLAFEDTIRNFIESHFDFIQHNPNLVSFVYNEVIANKGNRKTLLDELYPKLFEIYHKIEILIESEVNKGTIRPIKALDLVMNIVSLNVITFMAYPIIQEFITEQNLDFFETQLKERKESNVQFILNALRA